jgi:hypothetical protein
VHGGCSTPLEPVIMIQRLQYCGGGCSTAEEVAVLSGRPFQLQWRLFDYNVDYSTTGGGCAMAVPLQGSWMEAETLQ